MKKSEYESFKILILGDDNESQTALIQPFVHDKFQAAYLMTIGMEPYSRYETIDGIRIVYSLWDIAGQEKFKVMKQMFYKDSDGALVFFDLTRGESLDNATEFIKDAKDVSPGIKYILVGYISNPDSQRVISKELGESNTRELGGIGYMETFIGSDNIPDALRTIARQLLRDLRKL